MFATTSPRALPLLLLVAAAAAPSASAQAIGVVKGNSRNQALTGVVHTCLVRPGATTGQLFSSNVVWGDNRAAWEPAGPCQGASSWAWVERIATGPTVTPTPPQTPGVAHVVDSLRAAETRRTSARSYGFHKLEQDRAALFERASAAATPITVFSFVLPRGVFPNEAEMLSRGAAQPTPCPSGSTYSSKGPSCVEANQAAAYFLGSLIKVVGR